MSNGLEALCKKYPIHKSGYDPRRLPKGVLDKNIKMRNPN
jgi:hypothetical protein